jgi:hypothetical protein
MCARLAIDSSVLVVVAAVSAAWPAAAGETMFKLTESHLALLRKSIVVWAPMEAGVPAVLPSPELLADEGGPAFYLDLARRAGLEDSDPPSAAQSQQLDVLMAELPEALAQLLAHGRLEPGTYDYANPLVGLEASANFLPEELRDLAKQPTVRFALTDSHLKLLRRARWEQLFMNAKRPYGDMTYFELDMAEILGEPTQRNAEGHLPEAQAQRLWKLHVETLQALQLYLQRAEIPPGPYERIAAE